MHTSTGPINHFVLILVGVRSHCRPVLAAALNLLELHPSLVITNILSTAAKVAFDAEIALHDEDYLKSLDYEHRFRSILVPVDGLPPDTPSRIENEAFSKAMKGQRTLEDIWEGKGEGMWSRVPCFVLVDVTPWMSLLARS